MSQPTRKILKEGHLQVKDGDQVWHQRLPDWMQLSEELADLTSLEAAVGAERLLALAHKGLVQAVIDVRAQARAKNKDGEYTGDPAGYEPNPLPKPAKTKAEKALEAMSAEELNALLKSKGLK